ncbi:MAG: DegT/DnrJ/EryC1/StrS family aminotransferase [Rhodospirillales bacterium]|nr:DegT/DnrJ/EryC1/StrS family aminotransferase [Rhodospirillales bacterium]
MSTDLALLGGQPLRQSPYLAHTTICDDAEEKAAIEVIRSGVLSGFAATPDERFKGGVKVRALEDLLAGLHGVKRCVTFNSATSALHGAMAAAGIGPGDEVITSPYTMAATPASVLMTNGIPVFADIEDRTYGLDPDSVKARITGQSKAILTVNLFGHPGRLHELKALADRHGLMLIEDNSQSPMALSKGRLAGTIGRMGILSLNYHKAVQTGEGGAVLTDDEALAERLCLVRNHGEALVRHFGVEDISNSLGWNYRMTEISAAIGIEQIKKLEKLNGVRISLAARLSEGLGRFDFLAPPIVESGCSHVFYLYAYRYDEDRAGIKRSTFAKAMQAEGVQIGEGYLMPLYLEPIYQQRIVYGKQGCPIACPLYKGAVSYEQGLCPTAERLWRHEMLTTNICRFPNGPEVVDEYLAAIDKVAANLPRLRAFERANAEAS